MKGKHNKCHRKGTKTRLNEQMQEGMRWEIRTDLAEHVGALAEAVFLGRAVNSGPYGKYFGVKEKAHFLKPGIRKKGVALNFTLKASQSL